MAHLLLRRELDERGVGPHEVVVRSAGLRTEPGRPIDPYARKALRRRGVEAGDFSSQPLVASHADANVLLAATLELRDTAVRLAPQMRARAFAWRELVALIEAGPVDVPSLPAATARLADVVRQVGERRGLVHPERPDGFDVPDPVGRRARVFEHVAEEIAADMHVVAELVASALKGVSPG